MRYFAILALIPAICYGELSREDLIQYCDYRITQIEMICQGNEYQDKCVMYFLEGEQEAFREMKMIIQMND